jgi:O-antigen/teichoic acid export membrane protein
MPHSTSKNFLKLGSGEALARLVAFGVTVILARRLGPAMYGIIGVAAAVMLYLTQLADGGIELAGMPAVARDPEGIGDFASAVLTIRIVVASILTAVVIGAGLFLLPQPDGVILALYSFGLVLSAASTRWIFLGLQRPGAVAVARFVGEVVTLVLVVLLVQWAGDIARVPMASVVGLATATMFMLVSLSRLGISLRFRLAWPLARPLFRRGRHLLTFVLLGLVLFNLDLILLRLLVGATAAGHYAAAYTLIAFCSNIIVAYAHSVLPIFAHRAPDVEVEVSGYQGVVANAFAVVLPVAAGGVLVAPAIMDLVFGARFAPAVLPLQILLVGVPIAAVREIPVTALIARDGEKELLRVNGAAAATNAALNLALIPALGMAGAAGATLVTELLRLKLAQGMARRKGFGQLPMRRMARPLLAVTVMIGVLLASRVTSLAIAVPLGAAAYIAVLVALGCIRFVPGPAVRWQP